MDAEAEAGDLGIAEEEEVVDVAEVGAGTAFQLAVDELVEGVQVDVGEELRGLVADGEAAAAVEGGEQMVAGEVDGGGRLLLGIGAVNDAGGELVAFLAIDAMIWLKAGEESQCRR